ncbi:MAG: hypothetical protein ACI87W_002525, partial [Halieaceae bacterium]
MKRRDRREPRLRMGDMQGVAVGNPDPVIYMRLTEGAT